MAETLSLSGLVPVKGAARFGKAGEAGGVSARRVAAVGMLQPCLSCLVEGSGDVHADHAAVLDGALNLDRAGAGRIGQGQHLAFPPATLWALARGIGDDDQTDPSVGEGPGVRFGRSPSDGRPGGHLCVRRDFPTAAGAVRERRDAAVGPCAHGVLRGVSAGTGTEQGRCGDLGYHGAVAVLDGPQNRRVPVGQQGDGLLDEAVDGLRVRGDVVDQTARVVAQGAQLGYGGR